MYDTDGAPCCYGFAAGAPDHAPDCHQHPGFDVTRPTVYPSYE
jgi:hypothetical protein